MLCIEDEIKTAFSDERVFDLPLSQWENLKEEEANFHNANNGSSINVNWNVWEILIFFSPYQSASIILGLDPYKQRNEELNNNFRAIEETLKQYTQEGYFEKSTAEMQKDEMLGDVQVFKIHRDDLLYYSNHILQIPLALKKLPVFKKQQPHQGSVDSEPVLENAKAYDVRERETHLLMIGALSNLLAGYKQKYQKGNGGINQSAISKDIESEIIELLQPETKTRTNDTIRPRIRESLNLITKAE